MSHPTDGGADTGTGLKPAPIEPGDMRKLRRGVIAFCIAEGWAVVWGSGLLWYLGLVHHAGLGIAMSGGAATGAMAIGSTIETWLAMLTEEPLLNDKDEIDSIAPTVRGLAYILPPFVAALGVLGIPLRMPLVSAAISLLSLLLFARLLRRIQRIAASHRTED